MEKNVRILRAESALTDLVGEAVGSLGNEIINSLSITRVECSRGISDAAVYILDENFSENEKRKIISELKKAVRISLGIVPQPELSQKCRK